MKNYLNYKLMLLRHRLNTSKITSLQFVEKNWLKLIVIIFAFNLVWSKEIKFSVDLSNAATAIYQNDLERSDNENDIYFQSQKDTHKKSVSENGHAEPSLPKPANTFSNLGFILNPSYAKRNNVPSRVVKYHNNKCKKYIDTYSELAISEMKKSGIPASIKLAQGLLESNAGDSKLARNNMNHFGIKCFSKKCKKGHCSNFSDDSHKDFFRKYESVQDSYKAHSQFLQKDRYKHLKALGTLDYGAWAHGLKEAGYATDSRYANKIIRIIENLKLYEYDE